MLNLMPSNAIQKPQDVQSKNVNYLSPTAKTGHVNNANKSNSELAMCSPLMKKAILARNSAKLNEPYAVYIEKNTRVPDYKNNLKTRLMNNQANIMAVIIRTMGAKDTDKNGLIQNGEISGNFINAVDRLDELKGMGINTLHVLPINPPGRTNAKGTAGSLYSPDDFLSIDPMLRDPHDKRSVEDQCKYFLDECHKRGISVMIDLPSCASVDMAIRHPELIAKDSQGLDKTPQGWEDIRMFRFWDDEVNRVLNADLVNLHKDYIDYVTELGFDGIRSDVARAKPVEFWDILIPYSHKKDPQFGWLAETYTYEDASPQLNMPHDRPQDQLNAGFDAYYGQYHIFPQWQKNKDLNDYVIQNIKLSNSFDTPKALIGSMATHDDISPMFHGGVPYVMMTTAIQTTLPQVNPYFVDGVQSGDYYLYPYAHARNSETRTRNFDCHVRDGIIDIFNLSRQPGGNNPEIGAFIQKCLQLKDGQFKDVINKGAFIPLETTNPKIFAYARHLNGKTLLVVANRDVNFKTSGNVTIPDLKKSQNFKNMLPNYAEKSYFQTKEDGNLTVDLSPSSAYVFEIDTPKIEELSKGNVYKELF